MKNRILRKPLLPISAALFLALGVGSAFAGGTVTLERVDGREQPEKKVKNDADTPAWHRKLWNGSFDAASDASGAAARQLEGLDFGDCNDYLKPSKKNPQGDQGLYQACVQRQQASGQYAQQARSIQKQQKTMSLVSKAADVAAVGAVGAVIYGEMGVKDPKQAGTYESAANIEKKAGEVSYITGAADLTMGAYAYVAQKNKLEQIKNTISGANGGVKASSDPAVTGALTSAVEAAKKAAYSHMMWGAGKVAAGYGMMYLAKKSQDQADKMATLDELKWQQQLAAQQAAQQGTLPQQTVVIGSPQVPYYQNNQPGFSLPNSGTAASGLAAHNGPVTYSLPGGGTGSSAPLSAQNSRALASAAATGKISGGGGGGGEMSGASKAPEEPGKEKIEKAAKEAMGSSFEMQLTGGVKSYGGGPAAAGKDEVPNLAAMMGGNGTDPTGARLAATGLSPSQILQEAQEGTDGTEEGSMAGVSGKSGVSLFEITKAKLTKMFQVGNVGIPKNVEVKN